MRNFEWIDLEVSTIGNSLRRIDEDISVERLREIELALDTGVYYTNPYGTAIVDPDSPNAVEQYIQQGLYLDLRVMSDQRCVALDPWTMEFECMRVGGNSSIEHSPFPEDHRIERALYRN